MLNVIGHPFNIQTETGGAYSDGVTGNGRTAGALVFAVSANAPDKLRYQCSLHTPMTGPIFIVD